MTIENERREFARVAASIGAKVVSGDAQLECESTRNLSMSGAYFISPTVPPVGERCEVQFEFRADDQPILIEVNGDVVRHGDDGFAVKFEEAQHMEHFEKIRNLVIYRALEAVSLPLERE